MAEAAGRKNQYVCRNCGAAMTTVNLVEGTTPFMVECRAKDCPGLMQSLFYRVDQDLEPTHEWFRPTIAEAQRMGRDMLEHVVRGGLDIRPVVAK